jgi:hypothetical protein
VLDERGAPATAAFEPPEERHEWVGPFEVGAYGTGTVLVPALHFDELPVQPETVVVATDVLGGYTSYRMQITLAEEAQNGAPQAGGPSGFF